MAREAATRCKAARARRRAERGLLARALTQLLLASIRAYQLLLAPLLGRQCRFWPTCSSYAFEAIERHGALRGTWLAVRRIGRCRPGGGSGYDPVPEPESTEPP